MRVRRTMEKDGSGLWRGRNEGLVKRLGNVVNLLIRGPGPKLKRFRCRHCRTGSSLTEI